jgi:hypothetical protein
MRTILATFLMLAFCACVPTADARNARSHAAKRDFVAANPCPSTRSHKVRNCPGYIIDHVNRLCAGGPDAASNMQWQTVRAARVKDRQERAMCRRRF